MRAAVPMLGENSVPEAGGDCCEERGDLSQSRQEAAEPAPGCFCQLRSNKIQAAAAKRSKHFLLLPSFKT